MNPQSRTGCNLDNKRSFTSSQTLRTCKIKICGDEKLAQEYSEFVMQNTVLVAEVPLVPEIQLRLITDECDMYRAGENELETLRKERGIEAPFWGFAWPGGATLARYIIDNPELVRGKRVLDIGSGCGIVALACKLSGAMHVHVNDIDEVALISCKINAEINHTTFDRLDAANLIGDPTASDDLPWDVVVAGDICYDDEFASTALAWLKTLAQSGVDVVIGDPGRPYLPRTLDLHKIAEYDLQESFQDENHGLSVGSLYRLKA
eukprot:CFRG2364T1